jgi:hypothetical protein
METYLEGFQIDMETLALTEEEEAKLEQAAQQPDPKVTVAQIEAQAEVYKADLRKEVERLKLALDAQFKRLSLEQAQAEAQIKSDTTLTKEAMKTGQATKEDVAPAQAPAMEPVQEESVEPEQSAVDVDKALAILGLQ